MLALATTGFALSVCAQQVDSVKKTKINLSDGPLSDNVKSLVIIDGNKQFERGTNALHNIDPNKIEAITIWSKKDGLAKFGSEGLNGVIEVKTKAEKGLNPKMNFNPDNKNPNPGIVVDPKQGNLDHSPMYIVDGVETEKTTINNINPDDIESFNILKSTNTTLTYGEAAKNGVIIITTKKNKIPLKKSK